MSPTNLFLAGNAYGISDFQESSTPGLGIFQVFLGPETEESEISNFYKHSRPGRVLSEKPRFPAAGTRNLINFFKSVEGQKVL
jgi:hypothetical protein